mmetsp:Transcript_37440/g.63042  ORF Transcript_37440/g.63042 Transcript_37440/m.63042 type:complete len:228 (+) Transcript_37440:145-828(+)
MVWRCTRAPAQKPRHTMASATVKARPTLRSVRAIFGGRTMLGFVLALSTPTSHLMISGSSGMSELSQRVPPESESELCAPRGRVTPLGKVTLAMRPRGLAARFVESPPPEPSFFSMGISRVVAVEQLKGEPTSPTNPEASFVDTFLVRVLTFSRVLFRTCMNSSLLVGLSASVLFRTCSASSSSRFTRSSLMLYIASASSCKNCCRFRLTCPVRRDFIGSFLPNITS